MPGLKGLHPLCLALGLLLACSKARHTRDDVPDAAAVLPSEDIQVHWPASTVTQSDHVADAAGDVHASDGAEAARARVPGYDEAAPGRGLFAVREGRLVWLAADRLYVQQLPNGAPRELARVEDRHITALDHDGTQVVLTDRKEDDYLVFDLASGEQTALIDPEVEGRALSASLDGDWLAYALDQPASGGGWPEEMEVYLADLRTGEQRVIAPHRNTLQHGAIVRDGWLMWIDDRLTHHAGHAAFWHPYDVKLADAARAHAGEDLGRRLTDVQGQSTFRIVGFDGDRAVLDEQLASRQRAMWQLEVADGELLPVDGVGAGDEAVAYAGGWIAVVRGADIEQLDGCQLEVVELATGRVDTVAGPGRCPWRSAIHPVRMDDTFIAWQYAVDDGHGNTRTALDVQLLPEATSGAP